MLSSLYHLVHADFFERTRRYSFLLTLALSIYVGHTFVPPLQSRYVTVAMGDYRGIYNSAWIGAMVALMTTVFLALAGFYLVKNSIERDQRTGVGQIIATTPLPKSIYALGKALSNFAVLMVMVAALAVVALIMQYVRAEDTQLNLWALLAPFLLITLPAMAVVAALAVLFEMISWLRGGLGNVIYFFLWTALLSIPLIATAAGGKPIMAPMNDVFGISIPLASMSSAAKAAFPDYTGEVSVGYEFRDEQIITLRTFRWEGMALTAAIVFGRLLWFGVAAGIVLLATFFFHRFDPSREPRQRAAPPVTDLFPAENSFVAPAPVPIHLTPLPATASEFRFGQILWAELMLMLKGLNRWWIIVMVGLLIASLATPLATARQWILPLVWIWPLLLWSALGTREARHRTEELIFSAPHSLRRQFPATWLAGVIVAMLAGGGIALRLIIAGDWQSLGAWCIGALFMPSLALACGIWSGSSKLFEVIYTLLWYIGPLNRVPVVDFMGVMNESIAIGTPKIYLSVTVALLLGAIIGRRKPIRV